MRADRIKAHFVGQFTRSELGMVSHGAFLQSKRLQSIYLVVTSDERCSIDVGTMELVAASDGKRSNLAGLSKYSPRLITLIRPRVWLSTEPRQ